MTTTNTDALVPSCARTSVLAVQTRPVNIVQMAPKASADCLDYSLDFTDVLKCTGDAPSAVNSAVVLTAQQETYDLVVMQSSVSGQLATLILASGQPGTFQQVQVEVATTQGRILSVVMQIQITDLTKATLPPSSFPADVVTNGKVLIAGDTALPTGYTSNGRVVMLTTDQAPVGTPDFESVTAGTYSGDGSGLNVTVSAETQTIAEWITALQKTAGVAGVGIAKIEASQGTVTAGESSTVTLTATLTDGTTTAPATFEAPPGADGVRGDAGAAGANGKDGAAGASLKSITATQGTVTAGEASTVTLTATLTDGTTASAGTFSAPAGAVGARGPQGETGAAGATGPQGATGAAGSDADVTAANIDTALGYTPANGADYFPLSIDNTKNSSGSYHLPALTRIASGFDNSGGLYTLNDPETQGSDGTSVQNPILQIGVMNGYFSTNFYVIKSLNNNPPGISLADNSGNTLQVSAFYDSSGNGYLTSLGFGLNGLYASDSDDSGAFAFINPTANSSKFWKVQASTVSSGNFYPDLKISGGTSDLSAWQDPLVSFNGENNRATFAVEPLVSQTYTYATLPTSPADWQRAIVTDKAIGSGSTGVMAMWNPNTKAWTGLSGETLT